MYPVQCEIVMEIVDKNFCLVPYLHWVTFSVLLFQQSLSFSPICIYVYVLYIYNVIYNVIYIIHNVKGQYIILT